MAASGRGLSRALSASPCPAWRLAHWEAKARLKPEYDAVVIGAGHNGLVAATYLQRLGVNTVIFERRHVIGGAAVTEEIVPGFKFSRASYLLSLLRPQIYVDLELKNHGLKLHLRNPYSFTPMLEEGTGCRLPRSLLLGTNMAENQKQIAKFSQKDAQVLDQWFESEPLKATLATDAVIGAMTSPHTPGSGYVLLHHMMGGLEGTQGAWGYVQGGMGALSEAIASSATAHGASIFTEKPVAKVQVSSGGGVQGVVLQDGSEVRSKVVLSNASPQITFLKLTPQEWLPEEFVERISQLDTQSPVTKINVAVNRLPDFLAAPNAPGGQPLPHHQCSIHLNCEDTHLLHQAFEDAVDGRPSHRPMIELCIPSSLDPTLAPPGCHVISLFTQYTPYTLAGGKVWDEQERNAYADKVFDCVEAYAPGFKGSVVGRDVLTPPDLERIFGLPGGNIFHGAMTLDQLYFARPVPLHANYRCPLRGLYLCGSGAHPGGGVMGAAGRNAAHVVFEDLKSM
ncbi:pyridine nucleotide-disulfide oxidoreductase domain-containing protein 2 isoform X3 [Desmodus rotundus]|uniref:pyridine nucleotide-disulfide oxidoreductase domain-containing protein 2 isoform X3 n=1 Tax=Desmodus rotundus TaxID=9430 RepID=UPI0023814F2D|nr:pyridine nucleotide-disulfide oxidoreductase domain-containing protein 2 isoform X3 [Desmodus rotundus]